MQFHHHGYVSGDPRVQPAAGVGIDRPDELPDEVDVLIVGAGPAGMIAAAQLVAVPGGHDPDHRAPRRPARDRAGGRHPGAQRRDVPGVRVRRAHRGGGVPHHRDGFWRPDPADPSRIVRGERTADDPGGISEFPHLIVNQARVLDYFAEYAANAPTRMAPDYGFEFVGLEVADERRDPVDVRLRPHRGQRDGEERTVRAKYVSGATAPAAGCARRSAAPWRASRPSTRGASWTCSPSPTSPTSAPSARSSRAAGNILLIPREGGHLFRMYVDLGEVDADDHHDVRQTTIEQIIAKANAILHPYTLDVSEVAWHSVYEVGHRLTDRFDDVPTEARARGPRASSSPATPATPTAPRPARA